MKDDVQRLRRKKVLDHRKCFLDVFRLKYRQLESRMCSFRYKTTEEQEKIGNLWAEVQVLGDSLADEIYITKSQSEMLLMETLSIRFPTLTKESSKKTHFGQKQQETLHMKINGVSRSEFQSDFQCLSKSFDQQDTELKQRFTSPLCDVTHRFNVLSALHAKSAGVGVEATRT